MPLDANAKDMLATWFGTSDEDIPKVSSRWWTKDAAFDDALRERFGDLVIPAAAGAFAHWEASAEGTLALILLLDQVSRNIFRGDPRSFSQDAAARELTRRALARGDDRMLIPPKRAFVYMPLMHSEHLPDHALALQCFEALALASDGTPWSPYVGQNLDFQRRHTEIIRRFGRYPHRNPILGRQSTAQERAWVEEHGGF